MSDRSKPRIVQAVCGGGHIFAFEEYWTEDNDGFCSTDFLWEKHTRLKIFAAPWQETAAASPRPSSASDSAETPAASPELSSASDSARTPAELCAGRQLLRTCEYDSGQREKELLTDGKTVSITYWPSYQTRTRITLCAETLQILEEQTEHDI